jgi:hypothetical protein
LKLSHLFLIVIFKNIYCFIPLLYNVLQFKYMLKTKKNIKGLDKLRAKFFFKKNHCKKLLSLKVVKTSKYLYNRIVLFRVALGALGAFSPCLKNNCEAIFSIAR